MTAVCEDYYQLDLAWLRRRKMLTPGRISAVTWSVGGNQSGAIRIAAQGHAIVLVYRTRSSGEDWQDARECSRPLIAPGRKSRRRNSFGSFRVPS